MIYDLYHSHLVICYPEPFIPFSRPVIDVSMSINHRISALRLRELPLRERRGARPGHVELLRDQGEGVPHHVEPAGSFAAQERLDIELGYRHIDVEG